MSKSAFYDAIPIMEHIQKHGYTAYFVGGAVRDYYLARVINDVDIATSAMPNEIEQLFDHTIPVGKAHGTINVVWEGCNYEVTTFRTEDNYEDHRRPSHVHFVRSLYEDVARRDFTINAMAMDTKFELYDYFNGLEDLKARCIRTVGNPVARFSEDALRIIRGLRFQSQLDFDIETKTYEAMKSCANDIKYLSVERIMTEFEKLLKGKGVEKAFKGLLYLDLMAHIPYFKLFNWQNVKIDTPLTLAQFLALIHLIEGKKEGLNCLKLSNQTLKEAEKLYQAIQSLQRITSKSSLTIWIYDYGMECAQTILHLKTLLESHSIQLPSPLVFNFNTVKTISEHLPIYSRKDMDINGKVLIDELHLGRGPWLKHTLREIECAIVTNKVSNIQSEIIEWVKNNVEI